MNKNRFFIPYGGNPCKLHRLVRILDDTNKLLPFPGIGSVSLASGLLESAFFMRFIGLIALFSNKSTLLDKLSALNSALNALCGKHCCVGINEVILYVW